MAQGTPYTEQQIARFCWVTQEAHRNGQSVAVALAKEAGVTRNSAVKIAGRLRKRGYAIPYDRPGDRELEPAVAEFVDVPQFVMQVQRETWQKDAACRGVDPELFFPGSGGRSVDARRVCKACPVCEQCLDYALRMNEKVGVWGGTTWAERRKMQRPMVRVA